MPQTKHQHNLVPKLNAKTLADDVLRYVYIRTYIYNIYIRIYIYIYLWLYIYTYVHIYIWFKFLVWTHYFSCLALPHFMIFTALAKSGSASVSSVTLFRSPVATAKRIRHEPKRLQWRVLRRVLLVWVDTGPGTDWLDQSLILWCVFFDLSMFMRSICLSWSSIFENCSLIHTFSR